MSWHRAHWDQRVIVSRAAAARPYLALTVAPLAQLSRDGLRVSLKLPSVPAAESSGGAPRQIALTQFIPLQLKRRGVELRLVLDGQSPPSRIELPLLKAVARARSWAEDLRSGRVQSIDELAKREGIDKRSVRRLLQLGFLSPRIIEAIVAGRQPPELTVLGLTRRIAPPLLWSVQEQKLGIC